MQRWRGKSFLIIQCMCFVFLTFQTASSTAKDLKDKFPNLIVEISGGITEATLATYCVDNVDVISLGKLTQGYQALDLSFKICKEGKDPTNPIVNHVA